MAQANQFPKVAHYVSLPALPPLDATELDVQDWVRRWYLGNDYQVVNLQIDTDLRMWNACVSKLRLTGKSVRELTR
jgi:hypothetical protein